MFLYIQQLGALYIHSLSFGGVIYNARGFFENLILNPTIFFLFKIPTSIQFSTMKNLLVPWYQQ